MDNPEEIEKIEVKEQIEQENADLQPENTENNEKLKQMDALVASYIAECYAEAEKKAKNTEKNAQISENLHTNAQISENLHTNAQNCTGDTQKCTKLHLEFFGRTNPNNSKTFSD